MKNTILILCNFLLMINCKNDDESASDNNGGGNTNNKMTFLNSDIPLNEVEFYDVPDDAVYLYVHDGTGFYNGFFIIFANNEFQNLEGTYTFHEDRFSPEYDPETNFWTGTITNHDTEALGENITGGEITVNVNGTTISLSFELETALGTATGNYTGAYTERL